MGVSEWWLYDLLVIAISVLCIWNGAKDGLTKALISLIISVVSCFAAWSIAEPAANGIYDKFIQETCREEIEDKLCRADITDNIRDELAKKGIYLPFDNEQIADMLDNAASDSSGLKKAAAMLGLNIDDLDKMLGQAIDKALEGHDEIVPSWAADAIKQNGGIGIESASKAASSVLRNDYKSLAEQIERSYIRPPVISFLKMIVFVVLVAVLSGILRAVLLAVPKRQAGIIDSSLGAAFGTLRAGVSIFLIVLLVGAISSMQGGEYKFYSRETIDKTYLFRIFYDMWI